MVIIILYTDIIIKFLAAIAWSERFDNFSIQPRNFSKFLENCLQFFGKEDLSPTRAASTRINRVVAGPAGVAESPVRELTFSKDFETIFMFGVGVILSNSHTNSNGEFECIFPEVFRANLDPKSCLGPDYYLGTIVQSRPNFRPDYEFKS